MKATESQQIEFFDKLRKLQDKYGVNLYIEERQARWQWADLPEHIPPATTTKPSPSLEWRIVNGKRVLVPI